jgi:hypothetical protein
MCAMGSCIKVVNKKIWFPTEKKMLSPGYIQNQNRRFSVMKPPIFCFRYSQNYKLTPAYFFWEKVITNKQLYI